MPFDWTSLWDYAAPAAAGAASYYLQNNANKDAANAARDGMNQSAKTQMDMYNQSRADTAAQRSLFPAVQGNLLNAPNLTAQLGRYGEELGGLQGPTAPTLRSDVNVDLENDPIYQAQKQELLRTLGRRSAAQGKYNSSDADNAISRNVLPFMQDSYGRSLADVERQNQNAMTMYGVGVDEYGRQNANIMDRFNINSNVNNTRYGQILDMAKIGSNAASAAGQNSMALGGNLGTTYQSGNNALANNAYMSGRNKSDILNNTAGSLMAAKNNSELMNLLNNGNMNWLNTQGAGNKWGAH